jgi:hypothetical protein
MVFPIRNKQQAICKVVIEFKNLESSNLKIKNVNRKLYYPTGN